MSVWITGWC